MLFSGDIRGPMSMFLRHTPSSLSPYGAGWIPACLGALEDTATSRPIVLQYTRALQRSLLPDPNAGSVGNLALTTSQKHKNFSTTILVQAPASKLSGGNHARLASGAGVGDGFSSDSAS